MEAGSNQAGPHTDLRPDFILPGRRSERRRGLESSASLAAAEAMDSSLQEDTARKPQETPTVNLIKAVTSTSQNDPGIQETTKYEVQQKHQAGETDPQSLHILE